MSRPRRILVTGASGFIGAPTVRALLAEGFEVHAADIRDPAVDGVTFHRVNLLKTDDFSGLMKQAAPTHLMHLAWTVAPGKFWSDPANLDWVAASLKLVRAFAEGGGDRVVAAGTCAEYDWSHEQLVENETPLAPHTLYGAAKHSLHMLLAAYAQQTKISFVWGRLFFLYGPGEARGRLISDLIWSMRRKERFACSAGTQIRDFLHVEDAGRAFAKLAKADCEGPVNIASGEPSTIRHVIETTAAHAGGGDLVDYGAKPIAPGDPAKMIAAVDRLQNEVGFRLEFDLKAGLKDAADRWEER